MNLFKKIWNKELIKEILLNHYEITGITPTQKDLDNLSKYNGYPSANTIIRIYETTRINDVYRELNIKLNRSGKYDINKEFLIKTYNKHSSELGRYPKYSEITNKYLNGYNIKNINNRFGRFLDFHYEATGELKFFPNMKYYTKEECIHFVNNFQKKFNTRFSVQNLSAEFGLPSLKVITELFGSLENFRSNLENFTSKNKSFNHPFHLEWENFVYDVFFSINNIPNRKQYLYKQYKGFNNVRPDIYYDKSKLIIDAKSNISLNNRQVKNQLDNFNKLIEEGSVSQVEIWTIRIISSKIKNKYKKFKFYNHRYISKIIQNSNISLVKKNELLNKLEYFSNEKKIIDKIRKNVYFDHNAGRTGIEEYLKKYKGKKLPSNISKSYNDFAGKNNYPKSTWIKKKFRKGSFNECVYMIGERTSKFTFIKSYSQFLSIWKKYIKKTKMNLNDLIREYIHHSEFLPSIQNLRKFNKTNKDLYSDLGFVQSKYSNKYTKQELKIIGIRFIKKYGYDAGIRKFHLDPDFPTSNTIYNYFKSWDEYMDYCGYKKSNIKYQKYSDEDLIKSLKIAKEILNDKFSIKRYNNLKKNRPNLNLKDSSNISRRFGGWSKAIIKAKIK